MVNDNGGEGRASTNPRIGLLEKRLGKITPIIPAKKKRILNKIAIYRELSCLANYV